MAMYNEEIWDEFQWEAFLSQQDRRLAFYMQQLYTFMASHPPPSPQDQAATRLWEEALRTYLSERGWLLEELDNALPGLENLYSDENPPMDLEYRLEHAESDTHPALVELCRLRRRVQDWSDTIPGKQKDSAFVQLCAYISQVYIHMGKGHSFGIEKELLGGHIACTKRALHDANQALAMLPELENEPYMPPDWYRSLVLQVFETRNQIALYLQELRARFNLGID